jgi:hypothetical protein
MVAGKRPRSIHDDDTPEPKQKAPKHEEPVGSAAQLNERLLKKMGRELLKNPTVDLTTIFPSRYSERLAERLTEDCSEPKCAISESSPAKEINQTDDTTIDHLSNSRHRSHVLGDTGTSSSHTFWPFI